MTSTVTATWAAPTALVAALALVLSACTDGSPTTLRTIAPVSFDTPLAIPPEAESRVDASGTRVFELTAQEGSTELLPGTTTTTWGYNGSHLGPTLRAERGERVTAEVTNHLGEMTTVHWHGMHLPARMDGGPHQPISPGETWRPTWEVDQPAATLWYHPHPHGETERHVYLGLAGMFLIDDPEAAPALPSEYGVDDVPVIVQDKQFSQDGQFSRESVQEPGILGDTVLANGTFGAFHEVTTELVRLRVLNGSTARTYAFGFDDDREFQLVGSDGGLLAAPLPLTRIRLSPGERAEIVVALDPGEDTVLKSYPPELGDVASELAFGGEDTIEVLQLRAAEELQDSEPVPVELAEIEPLAEEEATVTREFTLASRLINGRSMDVDRVDEVVEVGSTEIWEVSTDDPLMHNFHVHDVQFQVLDIDGEAPPPELRGLKDTVYLEPGRRYRLIMRFEDYADPSAAYMYHCHLLRHEDEGLMGQFVVVEPGQTPQLAQAPPDQHQHQP
ncbi:multicopper oxidase domain-containing protein [Brevibacterium daeguense]|uniref:Multicopper oxidase domain-containing protein n=1 Tax=Brevibacterium daeguense TaxID=909936 RepID=A0ABP8EJ10_9MICO|nr:multicopper oxidase domain-containing protein [Brevibacterium daeguense]